MELAFLNGDFSPSNQYNSIQEYINQIGCSSFISSNVHKFELAWGKRNDRGLHPDAWHQKPSINDVCAAAWGPVIGRYRGCADISVWSPSSLWPASGSVITTTSRQGAIFLWISSEIKEKNIGFHSGQQLFFCSQLFLHFAKCLWNMRCLTGHR